MPEALAKHDHFASSLLGNLLTNDGIHQVYTNTASIIIYNLNQ